MSGDQITRCSCCNRSWIHFCANLTVFRTARPSSKHYATCQNFVSSRSRTLFFVMREGTCRGMLGADRDENRDEIREVATHMTLGDNRSGPLRVNERKSAGMS